MPRPRTSSPSVFSTPSPTIMMCSGVGLRFSKTDRVWLLHECRTILVQMGSFCSLTPTMLASRSQIPCFLRSSRRRIFFFILALKSGVVFLRTEENVVLSVGLFRQLDKSSQNCHVPLLERICTRSFSPLARQ